MSLDTHEKRILENCLANTFKIHGIMNSEKIWYSNGDTFLSVAQILDNAGEFISTCDVVRFIEKPYKWEHEMKELLEEEDD